jgi:hypothetical protein
MESMKTLKEINDIMQTIPEEWRIRWCGGENGPCACMGCVQIGNRMIMFKEAEGRDFHFDPEYINEQAIPPDIYEKYKITKEEWKLWINEKL